MTILILSLTAQSVVAQLKPVDIEQAGIQPTIQTGRPMPSWWDVKIQGSALLEGRFEFQLKNDGQLLATLTTDALVLTGPQQRIRVLLPPVTDQSTIDQLQVHIRFFGKRFNQDLGQHILRVAISRSRTFMALTPASRLAMRRPAERDRIFRRLAFESLTTGLEESVKTISVNPEPADLPQEPMAYCAYEMVVLFGDEFRLLKKPQLDALASWIRAGGSLYLEPTGILEQYHVDFLRNLTAFGPSGLVIQPDSTGRLIPGTILNDERLLRLRNGLGRIVLRIDEGQSDESVESSNWRAAAAFLWRLHADQVRLISQNETVEANSLMNTPATDPFGNASDPAALFARLSLTMPSSTSELMEWLRPEGVRMVPLWVLIVILGSFVVWIGPVDYFGLGWLKARKFTWMTFPAATFLVTGLTVQITNLYMSSAEARRGLVLRDIGDDGSVVRTNRFEMLFIASTRQVTTEIRKGTFSPLGTVPAFSDPYQQAQYMQSGMGAGGMHAVNRTPPPRLEGRIPTEFTAMQSLAKWTPQLNRHFWIPGTADEVPVDWQSLTEGVNTQEMFNLHEITAELRARVIRQFGPGSLVAWFGAQGRFALDRSGDWTLQSKISSMPRVVQWNGDDFQRGLLPAEMQHQPALLQWLHLHSIAVPYGLFTLTSQVGPTGGAALDDLPIYDPADADLGLLVIVVPKGDDFIVYRKLLRTGE